MAKPDQDQQNDNPATIRKGIYLSALIYVEGDYPPAQDFMAPAKAALKDSLKGKHNGLTLTLKKVEVKNNVEDEDEGEGQASKKGDKFEF